MNEGDLVTKVEVSKCMVVVSIMTKTYDRDDFHYNKKFD